jgi:hypothetical protein
VTEILFWSAFLLLCANTVWTIWRTHGLINSAVLVPLAWIILIPLSIILRPYSAPTGLFPGGFAGSPKDTMYLSIALANIAFVAFQWFLLSPLFKRLQAGVVGFFESREQPRGPAGDQFMRRWILWLTIVAIALAVIHLALMPRVPAWDLVTGFSDPLQPNYDREAADKFLPVPTLVRYAFDWNQGILFPILFAATVLARWRTLAIIVGVIGFIYVTATLEKFPSLLFIAGPFIAIAVRDSRPIWSKVVIGGLALSLLGPLAVNQAPGISTSIHDALHNTPPASATPVYDSSITTPVPGCGSVAATPTSAATFSWRDLPASIKDIILRRIGLVPAEVTYGWFAYFPAQHAFLSGSGWEPWKVLSSGYHNPANLVGLWMYCGHAVTLPTVSAYGSFIADGWAEFGYLGVLLGCLGLLLFGVVLELIRGFVSKPFCLALYAPSLLLFATLPPRAGILAVLGSSGLWLVPVLCVIFLVSQGMGRRKQAVAVLEHAQS